MLATSNHCNISVLSGRLLCVHSRSKEKFWTGPVSEQRVQCIIEDVLANLYTAGKAILKSQTYTSTLLLKTFQWLSIISHVVCK